MGNPPVASGIILNVVETTLQTFLISPRTNSETITEIGRVIIEYINQKQTAIAFGCILK